MLRPNRIASHAARSRSAFAGEAGEANEKIAQTVREVADRLGAVPAQVALAWVYAKAERLGVAVATIPGTRSPARLAQNAAALELARVVISVAERAMAPYRWHASSAP